MNEIDWNAGVQHIFRFLKDRAVKTVPASHCLRLAWDNIAERDDPAPLRKSEKSLDMCIGDASCSDNRCSDHVTSSD